MQEDDFSLLEIEYLRLYMISTKSDNNELEDAIISNYGCLPNKIDTTIFNEDSSLVDLFVISKIKNAIISVKFKFKFIVQFYKLIKYHYYISTTITFWGLILFIPIVFLSFGFFNRIFLALVISPGILIVNLLISIFLESIIKKIYIGNVQLTSFLYFVLNEKFEPIVNYKTGRYIKWKLSTKIKVDILRELCETTIIKYDVNEMYNFEEYFLFFYMTEVLLDYQSIVFQNKDLYTLGIQCLEKMYIFNQESKYLVFKLGFYYMKLGANDDALFYFKKLQLLEPCNIDVCFYVYFMKFIMSIPEEI